jgi:signal transduction histidine kinase
MRFRRLETRLLLAILAVVVLPFAGFAVFLESQIAGRMTREFVRQSLAGLAVDLAGEVDLELVERMHDLYLWANDPIAAWALAEQASDPESDQRPWGPQHARRASFFSEDGGAPFRLALTLNLNRFLNIKPGYQALLLIDRTGHLVACNGVDASNQMLDSELVTRLFRYDYAEEPWFKAGMSGRASLSDHHISALLHPEEAAQRAPRRASLASVGFAAPVKGYLSEDQSEGVLFALVSWEAVEAIIRRPVIKDAFRGLVSQGVVPSPYAWIWASDGDTILTHVRPELYESLVSRPPIDLPQMVADVRSSHSGMFRDYVFEGRPKTAAFCRTAPPERGFQWVVGVGIDDEDIVAASREQRTLLARGTAAVLLLTVLWTLVVARRTVAPVQALKQFTRQVAAGDLAVRVDLDRDDELGQLARAMNQMVAELETQRERLIKAEKDAAWREMARQVAHDLKNPLTPIQLSLDLLERARRENSPQQHELLNRTLEIVRRQVRTLRETANEFYEFTGGQRHRPEDLQLGEVLNNVLELHRAWADGQGIHLTQTGVSGPVHADRAKLERVLTNLVTNALQACGPGGHIEAEVSVVSNGSRAEVVLILQDSGPGLSETAQRHLFEPYFTTKGEGTGLGLAIAARIMEEMGGSLKLENRPGSAGQARGARAELRLPARLPGARATTSAVADPTAPKDHGAPRPADPPASGKPA